MTRRSASFMTVSFSLLMSCGSSDSSIGQSGPAGGDASAVGGAGGAGGAGTCVGAPGAGSTTNIYVDQLILGVMGAAGACLPRSLADGASSCTIVEATFDSAGAACSQSGRREPCSNALAQNAISRLQASNRCGTPVSPFPDCSMLRLCEIPRADVSCLTTTPDASSVGWCYVDPSQGLGDPSLVASCPTDQQRLLRFVGDDTPHPGATLLVACGSPPVGA